VNKRTSNKITIGFVLLDQSS